MASYAKVANKLVEDHDGKFTSVRVLRDFREILRNVQDKLKFSGRANFFSPAEKI